MRSEYQVLNEYLGDNTDSIYEFDFKIEALAQLLIVMIDDDGDEIHRVRGDDTTIVDSVDYDAVDGAGTVTLIDPLPTDYRLLLLLANDEPTQPYEFKNKGDFTLNSLERALDYLGGEIQRAMYLALRSLKVNDADDIADFDPTLPKDITVETSSYLIGLNADRDGIALYSPDDVAGEVTNGDYPITDSMSATNVTDMIADGALISSAKFTCEVLRGTTIGLLVDIMVIRINSVWYIHEGQSLGTGDHGLTFTLENSAATIAQVQIAADATGNGTLKFKKVGFDV